MILPLYAAAKSDYMILPLYTMILPLYAAAKSDYMILPLYTMILPLYAMVVYFQLCSIAKNVECISFLFI